MIGAVELAKLLGATYPPTDEQAAVIEAPLRPAVVIAGAGAGKTETMAARVVWLIANGLVLPDALLGLTFTRKAAAELGQRIRRRLAQWRRVLGRDAGGEPAVQARLAQLQAGEPTVLTYAAYAGRLVAEHAMRVGSEPGARLISPAVGWQLADAVSRRHPALPADIGAVSSVPRWVLQLSGQLADHLVTVDEAEQYCRELLDWFAGLPLGAGARSDTPGATKAFRAALEHRQALLPLVREFASAKKALPAVDFADQMIVAARVAELPEVAAIERARYAAVLLDEYQDTGHAQVETLRRLFGDGHPVTAVGDPFQSIYGWRGASAGNMARFAATFADAGGRPGATFALATSFRNDRRILAAANAVAAPLRAAGTALELVPADTAGTGAVRVARLETVEAEAGWVAEQLRAAWDALPAGNRSAAVLVRRRAQLAALAEALQAAGLPVEVVGLGGLLTTPEVADVVATLTLLARADAGTALGRLLTGARWRIGPRDLAALHDRARALSRPAPKLADGVQGDLFAPPEPQDGDAEPAPTAVPVSLVEALDDLGPAALYSPAGFARLTVLRDELRRLRRRASGPLPDLVAEVERVTGVDVEVAARADRATVGRAHLDRFLDEAADFAAEADEASLTAFLAYLEAARDEENGLAQGEVAVETERVQLLTVHGAKGLEWDLVAVPGLVDDVFPARPSAIDWTTTRHELPGPLRGDRADLPGLRFSAADSRRALSTLLDGHNAELKARHGYEEGRLAYVALTRARHLLLASGYVWDNSVKPRRVSPLLADLLPFAEVDGWAEPEPDAENPLLALARTATWPRDPFGPYPGDRGPGRRAEVTAGAELVRAADPTVARDTEWRADVDRLLAERARMARGADVEVRLPAQLSVSQLVELRRDPEALARELHRRLPREPAPWARRGTAFHTWLEQRWGTAALLDLDELPGAADDSDDAEFEDLRAAFEASAWADRTPIEIEVPFEMTVGAHVVRGRMDAVFGDGGGPDGDGFVVVDWKTGRRPTGAAATAAAVQLAAYRLAWARLAGLPDDQVHRVRAAFHYVRDNETVEPTALLDAAGLRALLTDPPVGE